MAKPTKAQKKAQKAVAAAAAQQRHVENRILKKFLTVKKVGAVLDIDEYNTLKTKLGSDRGIAAFAAGRGIKLDPAITNPTSKKEKADGPPAVIPGFTPSTAEGSTPAFFDYQKSLSLLNAQGNIDIKIQKIQTESNKYVAQLQSGAAQNIASTQAGAAQNVASTQAGAVTYSADRQLESDLGVENIRAKGAIDLQGIINAGAANVENIRGEYNVKGKKVDRNTAILGGLVSAFNF